MAWRQILRIRKSVFTNTNGAVRISLPNYTGGATWRISNINSGLGGVNTYNRQLSFSSTATKLNENTYDINCVTHRFLEVVGSNVTCNANGTTTISIPPSKDFFCMVTAWVKGPGRSSIYVYVNGALYSQWTDFSWGVNISRGGFTVGKLSYDADYNWVGDSESGEEMYLTNGSVCLVQGHRNSFLNGGTLQIVSSKLTEVVVCGLTYTQTSPSATIASNSVIIGSETY